MTTKTAMSRNAWAILSALACTTAGAACSESPSSGPVNCRRDPALIAELRSCRADDDCPCGAACILGQCRADCLADGECGDGNWCDQFGRCRSRDDSSRTPPLDPVVPGGTVQVAAARLPIAEDGTPRPVRIEVSGDPGPVRVAAEEGIDVRCGGSGSFAQECTFDTFVAGEALTVWVRPTVSLEPGESRTLWIYHGDQVDTLSVTVGPTGAGLPPVADALTAGAFVGSASLLSGGVGRDDEAVFEDLADLVLPVSAQLFLSPGGELGVLVLDEPLGVLHTGGPWIGSVTGTSSTTATVRFPTAAYLSGTAAAGSPVEVLVEAPATPLAVGGDAFSFELTTRFTGVLMQDRKPQARWLVSLSRTGDLPADARAPTVPADVAPTLDPERGQNATPWEDSLGRAANPRPDDVLAMSDAEKRPLLESWSRTGVGTLESCSLTTTAADALAQLALRDAWGSESPSGLTRVAPAELTASGLALVARLAAPLASHPAVAATSVLRSSAAARTLPCRVDFTPTDASFSGTCVPADATFTFALGSLDLCADMAAAYGCETVDSTGVTLTVQARLSYEDAGGCVRSNPGFDITGTVTAVCRMPVVPPTCAEMALCYEPPDTGGATRDSVAAPYLDAAGTPLPVSGDLRCAAGARSAALDADLDAELPVGDPARLDAQALIDACAANLDALRETPAPALEAYGTGLRSALASDPMCLDGARVYWALGLATDADRRRALRTDAPIEPLSAALVGRLLQRWLVLHAFPAREAAEAERMAQVFRDSALPEDPTAPIVEEVLADSLAGWDILLHPRFATAVATLAGPALVEPDYRPRVTGGAVVSASHHTQTEGLPVAMLETLFAQLALLEPHLERAALERDETAPELLGRVLRYAAVLRPLAADLASRAEAWATAEGLPRPAWLDRYDGLVRRSASLLGRLVSLAVSIRTGENPLGITDEDMPLYYFGDEATATRRFSAISDFLIGSGPGSSAWAPTLVARAAAELDTARIAYIAIRQREVLTAQDAATLARRLDRIRTRYGDIIYSLCGVPLGMRTIDILEGWPEFNEQNCFVRVGSPSCLFDVDAYVRLLSRDQVQYQMCLVRELRRRVGFVVGFGERTLDRLADVLPSCTTLEYPASCADGANRCLSCRTPTETLLAPVSPDTFRHVAGLEFVGTRQVEDSRNACLDAFPDVDPRLPDADDVQESQLSPLECWDGTIGGTVITLRSAQTDLEIARSEFDDLYRAYDRGMQLCIDLADDRDSQAAARTAHNATMSALRATKLTADVIGEWADATKGLAEAMDVSATGILGFGAVSLGVISSLAGGAAGTWSLNIQREMDEAEQAHEAAAALLEGHMADTECIADAEMSLVGQQSATLRIVRAAMDIQNAEFEFDEAKAGARQAYDDGRLALQTLQGRAVTPLTHDLWLDEHIDSFLRDMRLARRLVFLAVRAVEYESQQSLTLEYDVLSAARPSQLQTVLDELWTTAATRGVGGARPTDLKVVLSLREHLLQLADHSNLPETEQRLTDVDRLRLLLQSPRFAEYDAARTYLGQRIPFELAPLGTLGLGDTQGIAVLAANDCAERIWSVNASILGSSALFRGNSPPTFTRIDLLKENTFYSQWCSPGDEPFQAASVRPSRNLFRDPMLGGEYGAGLGPESESALYTRARIEAYFNVERDRFEADDYANGETSELAARGLYGRYALFIPAEVLAVGSADGLVLNEVDDILLRLDYVSVAR